MSTIRLWTPLIQHLDSKYLNLSVKNPLRRVFLCQKFMKTINKKLLPLIAVNCILMAITVKADNQQLPLSPQEIAKLQRLFPTNSKNTVSDFKIEQPHEHIVWNQTPIDIILPVGKERMITFPIRVDFGYDKSVLSDDKLKVQNNNGTLYLVAKAAFPAQRVQVRCSDTGQIILLNLSAQQNVSTTPLDIVIADKSKQNNNQEEPSRDETITDCPGIANNKVTPVALTRFAAQQLYAPKRLLTQPPFIHRTPMHTSKTIPLLLDGSVIAMPLASWRGGDLFVTAVLMRNQLHQDLSLDSRNLCGTWQTATFFPNSILASAGDQKDSTTVFLVSNRPFAVSLQSCTRGY